MHVMVDLETLSTEPNAVILSIGAVCFSRYGGVAPQTFYIEINIQSCIDLGLDVSKGTTAFWDKQGESAKKLFDNQDLKVSLPVALEEFSKWWRSVGGKTFWGNGADFDKPILSSAYTACGMNTPYSPFSGRCFRTLKSIHKVPKIPFNGTKHHALHDAQHQAAWAVDIFNQYDIT